MQFPALEESLLTPEQLADGFASFSSAAQALERSYLNLTQEVERLRRQLDEERDLRRRREALAEVSALLAHEIRNPLGSVELFAGLLEASLTGEPEKDWIGHVQAGLRMVSATVNNILEFHGDGTLALQPIDLNGLLRSTQMFLAPLAERAGMQWQAQIAAGELRVRGDRQRLEQVFLNLALNAFRFAAEGRVVRVASRPEGCNAVVEFEDEGPGIDTEVMARLFEPGVSMRSSGTGLGLAVAKRIIEQHGGTISVLCTQGRGATFRLNLPLMEAPAARAVQVVPEVTLAMGATA